MQCSDFTWACFAMLLKCMFCSCNFQPLMAINCCYFFLLLRKCANGLLKLMCFWFDVSQLPNGVTYHPNTHQDRLGKLQEHLRSLSVLFRKLRLVYDKCNDNCTGMDPVPPEVRHACRDWSMYARVVWCQRVADNGFVSVWMYVMHLEIRSSDLLHSFWFKFVLHKQTQMEFDNNVPPNNQPN